MLSVATTQNEINDLSQAGATIWQSMGGTITNLIGTFTPYIGVLMSVLKISKLVNAEKLKQYAAEKRIQAAEATGFKKKLANAAAKMAESAAAIPVAGWAIAAAILAALIGVGIAAAAGAFSDKTEKETAKTEENIQSITQDIYNLNKSAQSIDTVASKFEKLNNKLIKTQDELKEIDTLLGSLEDEGFSAAEIAELKARAKAGDTQGVLDALAAGSARKRNAAAVLNQEKVAQAAYYDNLKGDENAAKRAEAQAIRNEAWMQDVQRRAETLSNENQTILNNFLANASDDSVNQSMLKNAVGSEFKNKATYKKEKEWKSLLQQKKSFKDYDFSHSNLDMIQDAVESGDLATLSAQLDDDQLADIFDILGIDTTYTYGKLSEKFINALDDDSFKKMSTLMDTTSSNWEDYIDAWKDLSSTLDGTIYDLEKMFPELASVLNKYAGVGENGQSSSVLTNAEKIGWSIQDIADLSNIFTDYVKNSADEAIKNTDPTELMEEYAQWVASGFEGALSEAFNDPELLQNLSKIVSTAITDASVKIKNTKELKKNLQDTLSKY